MQALLDREMPAERRRRPLGWWWMVAAALLVGLSLYLGGQFWPEGTEFSPRPAPQHPVIAQQAPPYPSSATPPTHAASGSGKSDFSEPADANASTAGGQRPSSRPPFSTTLGVKQAGGNDAGNPPGTVRASFDLVQNLVDGQPADFEAPMPTEPAATPTVVFSRPEENHLSAEPGAAASSPTTVPVEKPAESTPAPSLLPTAVAPAFPAAEPDETAPAIEPVRGPKAWALGFSAGLLSAIQPSFAGSQAGFALEWRPRAKWGLRSGLQYQFQQLRETDRTIVGVATDDYVTATGDQNALNSPQFGVSGNADASSMPVYVPVSRLHRLEAPLIAYWQPRLRWRLYGGVSVGTTLYAESGSRSLKNNTVLEIAAGSANQNLNQEISAALRGWDVRWGLGLGFKPSSRLSVDLMFFNPLRFKKLNETLLAMDTFGPSSSPTAESTGYRVSSSRPDGAGAIGLVQLAASWFF